MLKVSKLIKGLKNVDLSLHTSIFRHFECSVAETDSSNTWFLVYPTIRDAQVFTTFSILPTGVSSFVIPI